MDKVQQYIAAATRENTRKSYRSAVEHFEVKWGGILPATSDQIARYLVDYAGIHSPSTLKQRLSALASWHIDQGFPDPTKASVVKKVLKGIREVHPTIPKVSPALPLHELEQAVEWIDMRLSSVACESQRMKLMRDKAIMLVGFWRGFRSDELCRLSKENTYIVPSEGAVFRLHRSKGDRQTMGKEFKMPALKRLCPVDALSQWIDKAGITSGAIFRKVDRWGHLSDKALANSSILSIIRTVLDNAGVLTAETYGSHSLRKGFATWANESGWDVKTLMEYVGWKDVKSAMSYIEAKTPFNLNTPVLQNLPTKIEHLKSPVNAELHISFSVQPFSKQSRKAVADKVIKDIEHYCFRRLGILSEPNKDHYVWWLEQNEDTEEAIQDLIAALHQLSNERKHMIELTITNSKTGETWD